VSIRGRLLMGYEQIRIEYPSAAKLLCGPV